MAITKVNENEQTQTKVASKCLKHSDKIQTDDVVSNPRQ